MPRSIPACAGEPFVAALLGLLPRVYPRVCGGPTTVVQRLVPIVGLSPRVRGNRSDRAGPRFPGRSIPACAGEPEAVAAAGGNERVYPRVCGGTKREEACGPLF